VTTLISTGNLEDDFALLSDCDLIVEAVIERLDIKQELFAKLEAVIPEHCIVASNTSGLRIADMVQGRSERFKLNFLVMHFFNPVRYMKLLELVAGPETSPEIMDRVAEFGRMELGKGIVVGKDTPNFVGNRIGVHSMMITIHQMLEDGLSPEDVDQITGSPMGHPKSASFRTADLVGLDTFCHVATGCYDNLPQDEEREVFALPEYIKGMVEKGLLGNKTKGGCYKKTREGILVYDPVAQDYRPKAGDSAIRSVCKAAASHEDAGDRVRALAADDGPAGTFAWKILSRSLAYAARRIGEIADGVEAVDNAMKWGYGWELGPFETWDALGFKATAEKIREMGHALPACIDKMLESGAESFYTDDGRVFDLIAGEYAARDIDPREASLQILRRGEAPVLSNSGAEAWDIGDGVLALTFKTKANSIDGDVISMLPEAVAKAESDFQAMVIANEGEHFCVGANLFAVVMAAQQKAWDQLRATVETLQSATQRVKYAKVPVIAAPYGMTLGGGLELCLCSDGVQAAAETYSGLVEVGVGLLPGGAGNLNYLWRVLEGIPDDMQLSLDPFVARVFQNIATAHVATSALAAKRVGFFRHQDGVSFDRARQLTEAKARAVGMAQAGYHPPIPRAYRLPGESGIATMSMMVDTMVSAGHASEHDALIAGKVANVLCGGPGGHTRKVTEAEMLELEAEAFVSLCGEPKSQERMQHMLMKNKPLRN